MGLRGPRRSRALVPGSLSLFPVLIWISIGWIAESNFRERWIPDSISMRIASVLGATLMQAELEIRYSSRLESDHLVMVHDDLDHPEEDLAAMERHIERLEQLLGGEIETRILWVRGGLLGQTYTSLHGISLGSARSPEIPGAYRGDRHELAHAALDWFRLPGSHPPYVIHEGWAMSQCGDSRVELAQAAARERRENPSLGIRELLGPEWYHRASGPVYTIGGAFVDFLLRRFGGPSVRRFSTECQPESVEAKCLEIFGIGPDELDTQFWEDVRQSLQMSTREG